MPRAGQRQGRPPARPRRGGPALRPPRRGPARAVAAEAAIDQLITALPGVGPFTAQGILLRGAGAPDVLAPAEPRLAVAVERAYGLGALPGKDELARLAEPWRPFRSWVQVLLRVGE